MFIKKRKTHYIRQLKSFECFLKYTELPRLESMLTLQKDDEEFCDPEQG